MIVALLRRSEALWVFGDSPEDHQLSLRYQDVAPGLLALPEGQVRWFVEDPTGQLVIPVPAEFIQALIDGQPDRAIELLRKAVKAYNDRA